jgi:hypothetical protein
MRKKLDGTAMPGASPTLISPASMTRAVGLAAPATMACASPAASMAPAKYSGLRSSRSAMLGVMRHAAPRNARA